jgi:Reverse transcriptase (RNA-dependent DNA polymerase)
MSSIVHPWPCASSTQAVKSATKLNEHFINSVVSLANPSTPANQQTPLILDSTPSPDCQSPESFHFTKITSDDICRAIRNLPHTNSCGNDGITAKMLLMSSDVISQCLVDIFNYSLDEGVFPSVWKSAIVVPVFKKGDVFKMSNYRPISLLSLVGKVFEKIVCRQITEYLEEQNLLSPVQYGFRRQRSCETALVRLSNLLFSARRAMQYASIATIDYTKAFDCINFNHLLQSLSASGFSNKPICWLSSYLHGRTQRTKYYNALSPALSITTGVPQGSVLGPVLFNIFINSLLKTLPIENTVAYADDITLVVYGSSSTAVCQAMQALLRIVSDWSTEHGLTISVAKCFVMHISPKKKDAKFSCAPLFLDNVALPVVSSLRILGVTFSNDLSWRAHHDAVRKKVASMTGVIHRFGHVLNIDCRKKIVHAFVLPHMRYCLPIWGNTQAGLRTKMDNMLERTTRIITNDRSAQINYSTYQLTGIRSFKFLLYLSNVSRMFNIVHDRSNCLLFNLNTNSANENSIYVTRNSANRKIVPIKLNRTADEHCFQVAAIRDWNSLPHEITSLTNFNIFKSKATAFLTTL